MAQLIRRQVGTPITDSNFSTVPSGIRSQIYDYLGTYVPNNQSSGYLGHTSYGPTHIGSISSYDVESQGNQSFYSPTRTVTPQYATVSAPPFYMGHVSSGGSTLFSPIQTAPRFPSFAIDRAGNSILNGVVNPSTTTPYSHIYWGGSDSIWDGPFIKTRQNLGMQSFQRSRSEMAAGYQDRYRNDYDAYVSGNITGSQLFNRASTSSVLNDRDELNNDLFNFSAPPRVVFTFNSKGGGTISGTGISFGGLSSRGW